MKKTTLYYIKTNRYDISGEVYEEAIVKKSNDVYELGFMNQSGLFQTIKQFDKLKDLKDEFKDYKLEEYKIPKVKNEFDTKKI